MRIIRADDLKKADLFGKSDPYAKLFFNEIPVGETKVMKDNHFPIWNADFEIQVPNGDIKSVGNGNFKVVVYDFDDVGKHDFLGQVHLNGLNFLELLLTRTPKTYDLVPEEVNTEDKSIKGRMSLQCLGFVDENGNDVIDNPTPIGEVRKNAQKVYPQFWWIRDLLSRRRKHICRSGLNTSDCLMSIPIASSTLIISPENRLGKSRLILGWSTVSKSGYGPLRILMFEARLLSEFREPREFFSQK